MSARTLHEELISKLDWAKLRWSPFDDSATDDRMLTQLLIGGIAFRVEAIGIRDPGEHYQKGVSPEAEDRLNALATFHGPASGQQTVTIRDRHYVLVLTPEAR